MILASLKGFSSAASTMKHLKGPGTDTFFNRWPTPLVAIGTLKTCKSSEYDNMFMGDTTTDRLDGVSVSGCCKNILIAWHRFRIFP